MAKGKRCDECGAIGVPAAERLCKPCRIGKEYGPDARKDYLSRIAKKGAEATKAKRGRHSLDVDSLPALADHGSVKVWLSALAKGVASGKVSKNLSQEVRNVLKVWMRAHKGETTDEVVEEIQSELAELRERLEGRDEPWR